jgi:hypothetical protein
MITTEELRGMADGRHVLSHKDGLALAAEVLEWRKGQSYQYIGADGKTVLARDLEDELITARAKLAAAEKLAEALRKVEDILDRQHCSRFFNESDAAISAWAQT